MTKQIWVCQKCGNETEQPVGNAPVIGACPKCHEVHTHLKFVEDGGTGPKENGITEFVDAPEWYVKEFDEQMQVIMKKEQELVSSMGQYLALQYDILPKLREDHKHESQKQSIGLEQAMRRIQDSRGVKLSKQKERGWRYHPQIKKFAGAVKKDEGNTVS